MRRRTSSRAGLFALVVAAACTMSRAQDSASKSASAVDAPDLTKPFRSTTSEFRDAVDRFRSDRQALDRRYDDEHSPDHRARMKTFLAAWEKSLGDASLDSLGIEGCIDWVLLRTRVARERYDLDREESQWGEAASLLPFAKTIFDLHDARRRMEAVDAQAVATSLARLADDVDATRRAVETSLDSPESTAASGPKPIRPTKAVALRASRYVSDLQGTLQQWFDAFDGYDPMFSWWAKAPHQKARQALESYRKVLRERVVGAKDGEDEPIVGDPVGRDALVAALSFELIPYAPEDLIAIAEREFAWCEAEMKRASRDMGLGDDWKAALEKVKTLHVEPGRQPALIRDLAREAEAFLESHELITILPLAKEVWRIEMMSPEAQKVLPFFSGGEVIHVSFPTDTMAHEDKLMSLRGNNIHFSRATVHHELIPGHGLQQFMTARYNPHRQLFATPFWTEGWALYWEMLLWDLGFARSPEDRVGMLFWRMHRCARILFSLGFHLGRMTPQECIDFLVDRVGHERANATAEVRRSFNGSYPPLYQLAYMIGGLQFRALHRDLVGSGKMTNRAFHDAIIHGGNMPVETVRARLTSERLGRDWKPTWRFADEKPREAR